MKKLLPHNTTNKTPPASSLILARAVHGLRARAGDQELAEADHADHDERYALVALHLPQAEAERPQEPPIAGPTARPRLLKAWAALLTTPIVSLGDELVVSMMVEVKMVAPEVDFVIE